MKDFVPVFSLPVLSVLLLFPLLAPAGATDAPGAAEKALAPSPQQLIDGAAARGEKKVVLPPGEYRLASGLKLNGLSDFTLEGSGATLIFTDVKDGGLQVRDCHGLTLRGFTIDFDPLPFTQATVEKVDPEKGEVSFVVHEGYPDLAPHFLGGRSFAFSPETRSWRTDLPDLYAASAEAVDARHGRLRFSPEKKRFIERLSPGEYLVLDFRNSRGIRIEECRDVRLEGITFWSAPSIAVICRYMDGDNRFSYKIERGPLPPGATVPRLLSTSADGLNYAYARKGPIVENCDFSFMGDDAVNLHGIAFYVAQAEGKVVYLLRPYAAEAFASIIAPGDEARSLAPESFDVKGRGRVVSFAVEPNPPAGFSEMAARIWKSKSVKAGRLTVYRLELAEPLAIASGDFLDIPAIAAQGYTIRNNHFHHHRGRGIRLMSSHGLVESNRLEEIKQAGISMGPEYAFWREAGWVNDIMVRRNTIRRTGFDPVMHFPQTYAPGAISVIYRGEKPELPRPAMRNEAIRIEENTIEESGGPAIHINQAHGIDITGNTIRRANQVAGEGVGAHYGLTTGKPVCVDASTDVTIDSPEETP